MRRRDSLVLLVVLCGIACGGKTSGGQSFPDPGSSSGGDGALDAGEAGPWSRVCPETQPIIGSDCTAYDTECEYTCGSASVVCTVGGLWTQYSTFPCSPSEASNAAACPSTAVVGGSQCTSEGLSCVYDGYGVCACGVGSTWYCVPEPGCPFPRPRVGAPCSVAMTCDYDDVTSEACVNGIWQAALGGHSGQ